MNIVDEFLEGIDAWAEQLRVEKDKPCIFCGMIPSKMVELKKAVTKLKEKAWKYDNLCK